MQEALELLPTLGLKVPARQARHDPCPVKALKLPAGQAMQEALDLLPALGL